MGYHISKILKDFRIFQSFLITNFIVTKPKREKRERQQQEPKTKVNTCV